MKQMYVLPFDIGAIYLGKADWRCEYVFYGISLWSWFFGIVR